MTGVFYGVVGALALFVLIAVTLVGALPTDGEVAARTLLSQQDDWSIEVGADFDARNDKTGMLPKGQIVAALREVETGKGEIHAVLQGMLATIVVFSALGGVREVRRRSENV